MRVAMPNPFYQVYAVGALAAGAEPIYVAATAATGFLPDYAALDAALLDRVAATFSAGQDFTEMFEKMAVPDEAYFATVLAMQGYPLEGHVLNKDVTWAWWEKDKGSPRTWQTLPKDRLRDMIHSDALFARKFPKGAEIGKYGLHRSAVAAC